jgi:16S rRNA processing protein RimM
VVVRGPARPEGDGEAVTGAAGAPLLHVGQMVKPHGLRGDIIVSLTTNRDERVAPGSLLRTADGQEYRVRRSSAHQGRFIVTFDGVVGIDAAEQLRGLDLYAPPTPSGSTT